MRGKAFFLSALVSLPLLAQVVQAQQEDLPEISDAKSQPLVINSANFRQHSSLLVPELYQLFQEASVVLEAGKLKSAPPAWDSEWLRASTNVLDTSSIDFVALRSALSSRRGFLFGGAEQIRNEVDPEEAAKKILWNVYGALASQGSVEQQFQFFWVGTSKMYRVMSGRLARVYPPALTQKDVPPQLWRESIKFLSPQPLRGFEWLTFRLFGGGEDAFWIYSPIISKLRQLSGTNRGDTFFRSAFAPDDMYAWSGAWDLVQAKRAGESKLLVPFSSKEFREAVAAPNGCRQVSRGSSSANSASEHLSSNWNFELARFPSAAGWLPTNALFVPRTLWRLDLASRDPFSASGRQVIYVDQEFMMPVYRFVYDKNGMLDKTIIAMYGSAEDADRRRSVFSAWVLAYSHAQHAAFIVDNSRINMCPTPVEGLRLQDIEPSRYLAPTSLTPVPQVVPTAKSEGPDEL